MRISVSAPLSLLLCAATLGTTVRAQTEPETIERLRRDQDEILRKAERLQALMQRLQQRFERENKTEQVRLLKEGQAHLQRSGILTDVASIRDDLAATALTEALRKQKQVVDDLERLLNILLERKSVEQLDQQVQLAAERAATARELEKRQADLMEATRQAVQKTPTPEQKALLDALAKLQAAERAEAERNERQAGTRRPFLENALERVRNLLREQDRLDASAKDEAAGKTPASRAREFDLGNLTQRSRELERQLRDQQAQEALRAAGQKLREEAAGNDPQALQQARDRLDTLLQDAPKLPGGAEGPVRDPKWNELEQRMQKAPAGTTAEERDQLRQIGEAAEALAKQRAAEATQRNADDSKQLARDGADLAGRMRESEQAREPKVDPKNSAAAAVDEAAKKLSEAESAERQGNTPAATEKANEATAALERARALHQQQNPDAARQAAQMAAEANATSQDLQNTPSAEAQEQSASQQLDRAARALRETEQALDQARDENRRADVREPTTTARTALQDAEKALSEALASANQDGSEDLKAAAERQQQLQQQADAAKEQLQKAAASGQLTPEQQQRANQQMERAKNEMQNAQQRLQSGQQANAAGAQQQAADALQKAAEELQRNAPLDEQQKQALAQQGKRQQELADDIVRLAEELKKSQAKNAERAAEQAADAAKKAQRAMEQGDEQETEKQQQEAREKLQQAAEELEEEKDRYQDLRQEELLFRMRDELTTFLERQRPITQQTLEAQRAGTADSLSRPARKKLNALATEEQELAGKIEFLVTALSDEGNLVYQSVLKANLEDLREVGRRLTGRAPDPGNYTTMLQQDVERRTEELLAALERERQRREKERQNQKDDPSQGQSGQNKLNQQREKLVNLIAELEMLKQLGADTRRANDNLRTLVESRGDAPVTESETAMIERLAHRHGEITKLFQQIKQGVEESMQAMQNQEGENPEEGGRRGR